MKNLFWLDEQSPLSQENGDSGKSFTHIPFRLLCLVGIALLCGLAVLGQSIVAVPSTGAQTLNLGSATVDVSWELIRNTIAGEAATGQARIVSLLPSGWAVPAGGTGWIGPDSDQTNATRPGTCCRGAVTYKVLFNVTDPTTAKFQMTIAADESITMWLNGDGEDARIVYSTDNATFDKPETVTIEQGKKLPNLTYPLIGPAMFVAGRNIITVEVTNDGGGPTGLYINTIPLGGGAPTSYTGTAQAPGGANATSDPVDSGSGQFYDTETDFRLGGPMQVGFERYYASQLSKGGGNSALGINWMTTYDVAASVTATKAQVLLFGGRVVVFTFSAGAWQLVSPLHLGYQFASVSGGYKFMDPDAKRVYSFSTAGALTKIEDRNGNAITVTPGTSGPTKVTDGLGRTLAFTYGSGQLLSVQDQAGRTLSFTYSSGLLAAATDAMKAVTNYAYTAVGTSKGLLTKETLPLGNAPVSQIYDSSGRVTAQTDGNNNTTKIAYDTLGATTITDADNGTTRHKNDSIGDIAQLSDPMGGTANLTYDSAHRRTSITDKSGGILQYVYHPQSGYISAITDANGNTTSYTYSAQTQTPFTYYNLTGVTFPDGKSAIMTYDPAGNLLSSSMPDSGTNAFVYNSQGRITKSTGALGQSAAFTWNADGTMASRQDALGNTTKFEYGALKKLSKMTDPNGSTAAYSYDGNGRLIAGALPGQVNWTTHFDVNGQRDSLTNPLAARYAFTYTPTGKIATSTDPQRNVTSYTYDKLDRLAKIQNGAGETQSYTYDSADRMTSVADSSGPRLSYGYDAEGHIIRETDATGGSTMYTYDKAGRAASATTAGGNISKFEYDSKGNLVGSTTPLGDQFLRSYDAVGRLLSVTGPDGAATTVQRDAAGNPVSFTSPNGNTCTLGYDEIQRLSSFTDPMGNVNNYTYKGTRLAKIDFPMGSVRYTYDLAGRPTRTEYSDGTVIDNGYSDLGPLTSSSGVSIQSDSIGTPTNVNGIAITVDGVGKPLTLTYAAGSVLTYTFDKAGRVNSVSDWTGGKTTIAYDAASRRAADTFPNGVTTAYGYNADGRRNSITYGTLGSIQLTLDAVGKITSADRNLPIAPTLHDDAKQFSYNAGGQLASAAYDALGRVTSQDTRSYTWNLASQLVGFADPTNSAKITYDGIGEMNSTTATGAPLSYVFNYAMKYPALSIVRQDGNDLRYFVYLPDGELLYSIEAASGARRFYHFDEMGNTAFLSDNSGAVTDSYGITPYGEVADHIGTSDNPFTWQGQYGAIQEGNGLYFLRSRHYDASTARFLSPDPIMSIDPLASEPYAYAGGNPLLYVDPYGSQFCLFGFCVGSPDPPTPKRKTASPSCPNVGNGCVTATINGHPAVVTVSYVAPPPPPLLAPAVLPELASGATCIALSCVTAVPSLIAQWVISHDGGSVLDQDGKVIGVVSHDAGGVISHDGGSVLGLDGRLIGVISHDGGSIIGPGGQLLAVISHDGGSFTGPTGLVSDNGLGFQFGDRRAYSAPSPIEKPKNNKN